MDFKHEIIGLKHQGDKNSVDENVSNHGKCSFATIYCTLLYALRNVPRRCGSKHDEKAQVL